MTATPPVVLRMAALPENVAVVRQALAGLADAVGIEAAVLADMKMAVTEAVTNVVVHAYPQDEVGDLEVDADPDPAQVTIVVRDRGCGIQSQAGLDSTGLGLGLPLIASLSDSYAIAGGTDLGTEVRMTFAYQRDGLWGGPSPPA